MGIIIFFANKYYCTVIFLHCIFCSDMITVLFTNSYGYNIYLFVYIIYIYLVLVI